MDLKEIISIQGKRGLYKLVSQGKNNVIVESLTDHSRMPVFNSNQTSSLNSFCVSTHTDDILLAEILKRIFRLTKGEKISEDKIKDNAELKNYMREIVSDYDEDKVHVSDMKKIFSWYNILLENNLISSEDIDEVDEVMDEHTEIKDENPQMDNED
ncbi:MAG: DUF5606 domain-containing protein [Bacteroidales bacterium]|jgi:aldehyde:ferredoxin oxidoreductase|nr:DUF5606 domain-containing protein [Bacteroidales bacterium]